MKAVQFTSPWEVDLVEKEKPRDGVLIKNICSIISAGTEMAILSGGESWATLPFIPGYGSVGIIESDREGRFKAGQAVFTYGTHSEFTGPETVCLPLPPGLPPQRAVFARMAAVSITAIRVSSIELGDSVAVIGGGIVGNLAAQLAGLSGAEVVLIDPIESRQKVALQCGISRAYPSIGSLAGSETFSTLIDATGSSRVILEAAELAAHQSEMILLGSPRGTCETDITPFLNKTHLFPVNMTLKGAHEWRFPIDKDPKNLHKHSITRNLEIIFKAIQSEKLKIDPLLTHRVSPEIAPEIYRLMKEKDPSCLGAVIEW
jgi:2-desacetyl-2-hydroxyethyl bacteriochlorophyllide A dehydrogenase